MPNGILAGLIEHRASLIKELTAVNVLLRIHKAEPVTRRLWVDTALKHLSKLAPGSEFGAKDIRAALGSISLSSVSVILAKLEGSNLSEFVRLKGKGATSGKIYRWLGPRHEPDPVDTTRPAYYTEDDTAR